MTNVRSIGVVLVAAVALGCGASTQNSATIGSAGGVVTTDNVRLDVPAGALQRDTLVTVRESTPNGTVRRVEIEPGGLAFATAARVNVRDDGTHSTVKLVGATTQGEATLGRCCHGAPWHSGDVRTSGRIDLVHGAACDPACAAGQVCDDGVCVVPDAFCSHCGPACGTSGCAGWMCGCNGGMCGCEGSHCSHDSMGCMGGMC